MGQTKTSKKSVNWRDNFFRKTIQWMYVAQSAKQRALVVANLSGKFQLHAHDLSTSYQRQVTRKSTGEIFGSISPDGDWIYYLQDKTGDERGHFYCVPFTGGKAIDVTPDLPPYFSYTVSSSLDNKHLCFVASFADDNVVYSVDRENTVNTVIYKSKQSISEPIMSLAGDYICFAVMVGIKKVKSELIIVDSSNGKVVSKIILAGSCIPLSFRRDSGTVLVLTNDDGKYNPAFYDLSSGRLATIKSAKLKGDVFVLDWDQDSGKLLLCDVYRAEQRLFVYDLSSRKTDVITQTEGNFDLFFGSATMAKDKSWIIRSSSFNSSSGLYKLNSNHIQSKPIKSVFIDQGTSTKYISRSVYFKSSDGQKVQAWVVIPERTDGKLPFIIDVHGGPHGVAGDEYSPEVQAWLSSGFGYCTVNYRGSIGFGKVFAEKIYGNPGHWEVEDVVAARRWLVRTGLADPERIVLSGWSWGGYVTLLALGKYPDLWSGGIAGAAITDFIMQYEDQPSFFKAQDDKRFGGSPKKAKAQYVKSSPVTYIDKIQAPIFMMHGRNDARCPARQIRDFEKKMKRLKKQISVRWFDAGHVGDFTNLRLRVSLLNDAITFARQVTKNKNVLRIKP